MPFTKEEREKRAQERQAQRDQVDKLVSKGMSITEALEETGISKSIYYYDSTKKAAKAKQANPVAAKVSPKRKYTRQSKLTVTELPITTKAPMAFMLMGSPAALAEFARTYE